MSSIIRTGETFHGISVESRGVFTDDKYGMTYAGQCRDGYACGLGVLTWLNGTKSYAEHGPDGKFDGRCLGRDADGSTGYWLFERGTQKDFAHVSANGTCMYNYVACAPDDPRLLALIAQVAPVEVRPAAPAPAAHHSPATRPQAFVRWIGRLGLPPQALAAAVATEVHPNSHAVAGGCATQPNSSHTGKHDRAATCARDRFAVEVAREAPSCTLTTAALCTRSVRCHAIVEHTAC
jgi:hypothetical protein